LHAALRELLDVCPLNLDVKKVRLQCGTTAEDDVLIIVGSGAIPLIAHIPKIATVDQAQVFLAAMPSVPIVAVGDSLVSPLEWTERWKKVRQSADLDRSN
jgi:hypothetical protein